MAGTCGSGESSRFSRQRQISFAGIESQTTARPRVILRPPTVDCGSTEIMEVQAQKDAAHVAEKDDKSRVEARDKVKQLDDAIDKVKKLREEAQKASHDQAEASGNAVKAGIAGLFARLREQGIGLSPVDLSKDLSGVLDKLTTT